MSTTQTVQIKEKPELARSPYRYLLDDPKFMRWYKNVKRGSVGTAHEWVRRFGLIHKRFGKLPADLAKMTTEEAGDFLLDMVTVLEEEGNSGSYISNCVKPVKNWLNDRGVYVQRKIKIKDRHKLTTVNNEKVPTQRELGLIIAAGNYRAKVMSTQMGFSGFREEVFGDSIGSDGLTIKDLPEMIVDTAVKKVIFTKIPTMVIVRDTLSKAGHQFFSFLANEGCEHLAHMLEGRMEKGEVLNGDSPIITQLKLIKKGPRKVDKYGFLRTANLAADIKDAIVNAGFTWRPYVLRRYFETWMMLAEADGIIINEWRDFWAGHKGKISAEYTVKKGLPEEVIEKMRSAYAKAAEKYLVTNSGSGGTQDVIRAEMYRTVLEMAHFTPDEIKELGDLSQRNSAEIGKLLEERQKANLGLKNGGSQKIILEADLEAHINLAWEHVKDLPTGKCIIKLPNSH